MIGRKSQRTEDEASDLRGFDDFDLLLGDVMRGERATLGKSLLDVQRELRIKANYIVAIENADPSVFDTPGFIAGYVRSYSRYLGLDPDWAFEKFCEESGFSGVHGMQPEASKQAPADAATPKDRSKSRKAAKAAVEDPLLASARSLAPVQEPFLASLNPGALGSLVVLAALIGGLGYGAWSIMQQVQRVTMVPVENAPGVIATVDPLQAASVVETEVAVVSAPSTEALDRLYRPQGLDVPVLTSRDGPIATIDPNTTGLWRAPAEPPAPQIAAVDDSAPTVPPVQVTAPPPPEVALVAVNPAWVRVRAADGTILLEKIMESGETYVLPASEEPAILRAGNSGSVYFLVDGEAFGPAGVSGSVASNVALSRDSLQETFATADLSADPRTAEVIAVAEASLSTSVDDPVADDAE